MKVRFDSDWKVFEKDEVVDVAGVGAKLLPYLTERGTAQRTGSKVRFNAKLKQFAQGEVVNINEFAERAAAYLIERGVAKQTGFTAKKGKETAERKPRTENAATRTSKPEPAKPEVADAKDGGKKE